MASFRRLAERLGELAQIPSRVTSKAAVRINLEIAKQFAQGTDPYGKPWARLKPATIRKKGHDLILVDTNRMQAETIAIPRRGAGIELVTVGYAGFHQTGTKWMVPREVLPDRAELPLAWQAIIREELADAFKKVMR